MVIERIKVRRLALAEKVRKNIKRKDVRRGLASLLNPIPNQYAKEGILYNFQFAANTFAGTGLEYTAYVNRPGKGRLLPPWLTFTPATRTFSGTPTKWFELETLQIVVEAWETSAPATKVHSIFILTIGSAANTGRICWRAGNTPDLTLTTANIGTTDPASVGPGDWVYVEPGLTRDPVSQTIKDKFNAMRANGAFFAWGWNNTNGLKAHQQNYFDFDLVEAGESVCIDDSLGATRAFNPYGRLWRGVRGKEIYVTNFNGPVTINSRNYQDLQNVSAIRCNRASEPNGHMQDKYIRFIGQPNNHVPFVNVHGIKLREGITWQIDGSQGYIEAAFIDVIATSIGFHWKPNTTIDAGDRRPWLNHDNWDMNQSHTYIHDCQASSPNGTEIVYLGGGGWDGATVQVKHFNADGTPKMVLHNGQNVQEYHDIRRFNSVHDHIRIEHNIFPDAGWDGIQTRCVVREMRIMYNYISKTARNQASVNSAQAEGIMADASVGEIAYNYIEYAGFAGIRAGMLGYDFIHHNVIVDVGQDTTWIPDPKGYGFYNNDRGKVTDDRPQIYISNYADWNPAVTYDYDSFQHAVKVKKNGKSFRSLQAANTDHDPETSPTWWEDTHEWESYVADSGGLVEADLVHKIYNNTVVNAKTGVMKLFVLSGSKRKVKNNLAINSVEVAWNAGTGADTATNIALTGITLANYFVAPATRDYRLKVGASAINAGTDLTAETNNPLQFHDGFKDFSGQPHTTPSVGAFEDGSPISDNYVYVINTGGSTPPPITINAGPDLNFNLPQNSVAVTAVKSDPARVLDTILWTKVSGGNVNILNVNTLTATFANLEVGTYVFEINVIDEFDQASQDQLTIVVNPEGIVTQSTFQWYYATDANGTGKTAIPNSNTKALDITPWVGQGKYFARGERPVAKTGVLIGQENLSNWFLVP